MRCEDYPCCGHEAGDCPGHRKDGSEIWTCVDCGRRLPRKATSSICNKCIKKLSRSEWGDDSRGDY